jgi:hypothetical protein
VLGDKIGELENVEVRLPGVPNKFIMLPVAKSVPKLISALKV